MRKSLLSMFLLFAIGMTANAQKFALIDMEYILKNIPAYQSATEELDQASRQWQSEVEKLGKEAKGLYDSYQASIKTLSDAQKSKKEEEIVAKEKSAAELRRAPRRPKESRRAYRPRPPASRPPPDGRRPRRRFSSPLRRQARPPRRKSGPSGAVRHSCRRRSRSTRLR